VPRVIRDDGRFDSGAAADDLASNDISGESADA